MYVRNRLGGDLVGVLYNILRGYDRNAKDRKIYCTTIVQLLTTRITIVTMNKSTAAIAEGLRAT